MEERSENCSIHPLMSLVLMLILPYVHNQKDLQNIRLVCRLWKDAAMKKWRSTAVIRLSRDKHCDTFCHSCHKVINQVDYEKQALSLDNFLELLKRSSENGNSCPNQLASYPFTRYRLGYMSLIESDEGMKEFWRMCGPHIRFLYLDHCSAPDTGYGLAFQQIQLLCCPNLEELHLHLVPTKVEFGMNSSRELDFQRDWKEISSTPALKLQSMNLNICKERDPGPGESRRYHHATPTTNQWRTFFQLVPNLKNLTVDWAISNAVEALKYPTITGELIKLSELSYSVNDKDNPFGDDDKNNLALLPGLEEYVQVARPPMKFVRVIPESTRWNRSYFRELMRNKLHHPHVRRLRIIFASFCYTYGFLHFLKTLLEWWHLPSNEGTGLPSLAAGYGPGGEECDLKNRMLLRRSLRHFR